MFAKARPKTSASNPIENNACSPCSPTSKNSPPIQVYDHVSSIQKVLLYLFAPPTRFRMLTVLVFLALAKHKPSLAPL